MAKAAVLSPRERIRAECVRRGIAQVVAGCTDLLERRGSDDDLIRALGGRHAEYVLSGGEGGREGYWPRVWAARGLLHAWSPEATEAIVAAMSDEAWRVREMAAKVVARHAVGEALETVAKLRSDEIQRVRRASDRAVEILVAAGA